MSVKNLKKFGRAIDEKLEKLDKVWETPHMLLSNSEAPDEEAQVQIENFMVSINKVHDELNELAEEQAASTTDVARFINECQAIISDSIKPDCDALEDFLQQHGYVPLQNENEILESEPNILKDAELESKIQNLSLLDDQITAHNFTDFLVEDDEDEGSDDKENDANNVRPTCIPTPVIRRLNPVISRQDFSTPEALPKAPIYSPYYRPQK